MSRKITRYKKAAREILEDAKGKAEEGSFAYELSAKSFQSHIDDLEQIEMTSKLNPSFEMLDLRIKSPELKTGSAPLSLVSKLSDHVRKTIGFAALRLVQGGIDKRRIPPELMRELDLRLEGLLPGSSRFIVSAASNRDMFDYGISKAAIDRMFAVLASAGEGASFLESVNEIGPLGARNLRNFLNTIRSYDAEADFTWTYAGDVVSQWTGSKATIEAVTTALEVTEVKNEQKVKLQGTVELLSKHEKIELRTVEGSLVRVLYPERLLPAVSELHLEQYVTLNCQLTETENPLTNESSIFYELLEIQSS